MDRNKQLKRRQRGVTLIELMVAILASGIVLAALGNIIIVNQKAMRRSQHRAALQGHTTVVMAQMTRAIRGANIIEITDANTFQLRDLTGAVTHTYQLVTDDGDPRLKQNGLDMADMDCTRFALSANADTTSLTIDLELTWAQGLKLSELNTVSIRNRTLEY